MRWKELFMDLRNARNGQALRHWAWHLRESGQHSKLYSLLVDDPQWLEAKLREFGSNESYLNDVQIALETFPAQLDAKQALTVTQLHVARQSAGAAGTLYEDTDLQTLTWLGQEELAVAYAAIREDAAVRSEGLLAIWRTLFEKGRTDR